MKGKIAGWVFFLAALAELIVNIPEPPEPFEGDKAITVRVQS